eukprot:CAMPEP_0201565996 /NCGR_PEP_ID=MMETSP0190_2-20130828/5479_1 /ASSEMBLY_ACC=CAM_ASM_000263 /TAXON_ID=37353 /ORGANISM="Rosalina sp." /LENGTH=441 /DNA_ID=CAMNT_0047984133 /DNA_START=104 /DNA_END=1429 /DNA_ORIENTATION=+
MAFALAHNLFSKSIRSAQRYKKSVSIVQKQKRFLNLHEFSAKELMGRYNVRVQRGILATTPQQAKENAIKLREMGARDLICKSQVLAGGRGKGHFVETGFKGGVKVCESPEEIEAMAKEMLGKHLVTNQTGPEGQFVAKVLIHEGIDFDKEFYLAFLLDRAYDGPCIMGSPMGGMEIEDVAEEYPDKIKTLPIDLREGLTKSIAKEMAQFVGFGDEAMDDACEQMQNLYDLFMKNDCVQVEINPFVQTTQAHYDSKVYCVDAKLGFDDFAGYRNKEIFSWKDPTMEDPREVQAEEVGLNYVGLDGHIGCMVNGAGLAMATMDVIKLHGGEPANFLDVGGGANEQQVEEAFKILTSDPNVKGILINIFGGIMKCDVIANGVIAAAKSVDLAGLGIPLVVRLAGTNVDEGKALLDKSGLLIQSADDLDDAAGKIVASTGGPAK